MKIALIGYGEVGRILAEDLRAQDHAVTAYDIKLAAEAGADGVVCSAHEAARLKAERGADFALVTPGIRLDHAPADDQRRVMTPTAALAAGSHYLVIGRPITQAADPHAVLTRILADIGVRA